MLSCIVDSCLRNLSGLPLYDSGLTFMSAGKLPGTRVAGLSWKLLYIEDKPISLQQQGGNERIKRIM